LEVEGYRKNSRESTEIARGAAALGDFVRRGWLNALKPSTVNVWIACQAYADGRHGATCVKVDRITHHLGRSSNSEVYVELKLLRGLGLLTETDEMPGPARIEIDQLRHAGELENWEYPGWYFVQVPAGAPPPTATGKRGASLGIKPLRRKQREKPRSEEGLFTLNLRVADSESQSGQTLKVRVCTTENEQLTQSHKNNLFKPDGGRERKSALVLGWLKELGIGAADPIIAEPCYSPERLEIVVWEKRARIAAGKNIRNPAAWAKSLLRSDTLSLNGAGDALRSNALIDDREASIATGPIDPLIIAEARFTLNKLDDVTFFKFMRATATRMNGHAAAMEGLSREEVCKMPEFCLKAYDLLALGLNRSASRGEAVLR
jgi:hypothetical protein